LGEAPVAVVEVELHWIKFLRQVAAEAGVNEAAFVLLQAVEGAAVVELYWVKYLRQVAVEVWVKEAAFGLLLQAAEGAVGLMIFLFGQMSLLTIINSQ
jgi:hypothetical protein